MVCVVVCVVTSVFAPTVSPPEDDNTFESVCVCVCATVLHVWCCFGSIAGHLVVSHLHVICKMSCRQTRALFVP